MCRWARWSPAHGDCPAFVVGKPIGVLLGTGVALLVGLHLPKRVHWRELVVGGFLSALGFTVALFFCAAIVPPGQLRSQLNMGVIVSLAGGPIALLMARLLGVGRFAPQEPAPSALPHPAA